MSDGNEIDVNAMRAKLIEWQAELERLMAVSAEAREAVELDQTQ